MTQLTDSLRTTLSRASASKCILRHGMELLLGWAAICVALPINALAAGESTGELSEIVVTAQKRVEDVLRVPISVSVFNAASFDRLNIENLADVATMTPGVDFLLNGPQDRLSIRGVFSNGGAATTAILIDDVPVQLRIHFSTMFRSKLRNSTAEPIRSVRLPLASEQYIDGSESA